MLCEWLQYSTPDKAVSDWERGRKRESQKCGVERWRGKTDREEKMSAVELRGD